MGVSVVAVCDDSVQSLSRHQTDKVKQQVKKWLRENGVTDLRGFMESLDIKTTEQRLEFQLFLNEQVLVSLGSPDPATRKFLDVSFRPKEEGNDVHLEVVFTVGGLDAAGTLGASHATATKQAKPPADQKKLRLALREKIQSKNYLRKSSCDKESELWKVHSQLSRLCANQKGVKIPTPGDIRSNKAMFEQMVEHIPDKNIKMYVQDCLLTAD